MLTFIMYALLLACLAVAVVAVIGYMLIVKPAGSLTVTYEYRPPAPPPAQIVTPPAP